MEGSTEPSDAPTGPAEESSLLRRIGIGPRLWIFVAGPALALVGLIALLVWSDIKTIDELRQFENDTDVVAELIEARLAAQDERHALLDSSEADLRTRPLAEDLFGSAAMELLETTNSPVDVSDQLLIARGLAETGQIEESQARYKTIIDAFEKAIRQQLDRSPDGEIDRRSDALLALLAGHEALLLEDLEIQIGEADRITITRLHANETAGFDRFARDAAAPGHRTLEALSATDFWRDSIVVRTNYIEAPDRFLNRPAWIRSAVQRRAAVGHLVEAESQRLTEATSTLADQGISRLTWLGTMVGLLLTLGILATFAIRRSLVLPLGRLAFAAQRMSRGELSPIDDDASDEIARVGQGFSSLHDTMEALWTDVDRVQRSVRQGEFDHRIDTESLEGDWLRLAETMNSTLETGARHNRSVEAELVRRDVLAEISAAALIADSAQALTSAVLDKLPGAVPGSTARLHAHPSGPPLFELGIDPAPTISALQLPTLADHAQVVELPSGHGVASLVDFGAGPPAVLVLDFGRNVPDDAGPLVGLVETAARVLAQAHRRQAAEWSATHHFEHDALTGLFNTSGMERWYEEHSAGVRDWVAIGMQPLRLDVLDSTYGRDARNALLTIVSRRLRRIVREDEEMIARIGDPEFVILAPGNRGQHLVDRIIDSFAHPLAVGGELVPVELTIGLAALEDNLEQAIANSATAIRQADGRTTSVVYFDERHREEAVRRAELERWLEQAGDEGEFEVHFQPVVNAVTMITEGYEALLRGNRNGVAVSPGEFIPIAEETGAILEIGQFSLREACLALEFLPGDRPYVSVNLSPVELADADLVDRIDAILRETAVDRTRIFFEVTEGAATTDEGIEALHRIRGLGVKIAIDDFGTGHANLSYLSSLPAEMVKIDRSLITPMVDDRTARTVVSGAVSMAHEIGMTVVGEGVETNDELNALRRVRCDRIQGWLTGRPAPLSTLVETTHSTEGTRISTPERTR